ncbi:hypothetical protein PHLGIDRAFT_255757 [Phlebiopsis gigantea 11061_1 CR5-6]|uniref:Uncharacterized protein n=1 Tax=Phlebiopsis gigantea (strain 11061_1 CR5-6) TaxID=745531 RepID=A0A0C3S4P0_PHLG1|nr:hypothetical protein PHLGIDRAFT_255757 [Phlebiopsis gigantea 11061_1 CR5-6]
MCVTVDFWYLYSRAFDWSQAASRRPPRISRKFSTHMNSNKKSSGVYKSAYDAYSELSITLSSSMSGLAGVSAGYVLLGKQRAIYSHTPTPKVSHVTRPTHSRPPARYH